MRKIITTILVMAGLVVLFYPRADKVVIDSRQVSYVVIIDEGNFSDPDRRVINDPDTLMRICRLLNDSKRVSMDTINIKASIRFVRIDLHATDSSIIDRLTYDITPKSGNILFFRGGRFRSDSLYNYLKRIDNARFIRKHVPHDDRYFI